MFDKSPIREINGTEVYADGSFAEDYNVDLAWRAIYRNDVPLLAFLRQRNNWDNGFMAANFTCREIGGRVLHALPQLAYSGRDHLEMAEYLVNLCGIHASSGVVAHDHPRSYWACRAQAPRMALFFKGIEELVAA
jgi:hypothetical protein